MTCELRKMTPRQIARSKEIALKLVGRRYTLMVECDDDGHFDIHEVHFLAFNAQRGHHTVEVHFNCEDVALREIATLVIAMAQEDDDFLTACDDEFGVYRSRDRDGAPVVEVRAA